MLNDGDGIKLDWEKTLIATKKIHYWSLVAVAFLIATTVVGMDGGLAANANSIARVLGAGFGYAIFPVLAVRFIGNLVGWGVLAALGIFAAVDIYSDDHTVTDTSVMSFRYHAKRCDFSVGFPTKPRIKTYTHPQIGDYKEALWTSSVPEDATALRTECIHIPALSDHMTPPNAKEFLLGQLATYVENNGLSSVEYRYVLQDIGPTAFARGVKKIQGISVTYQIMVVGSSTSLITLYAGGKSATFPQQEISAFLNSVQRVDTAAQK